jgi:oxygen-dependent protoporphyrinogen oxidase
MGADVDVCVIGGGLAGIAAALSAKRLGASVRVLEATDVAGGRATTIDGLERGPQSFNGRHEVFWQLLDQLGLVDQAVALPERAGIRYLARGGRLHALRSSPLSALTTSALTPSEKLTLLKDATLGEAVQSAVSIHDFFAKRFGEGFAEGPVAAMVNGIWAGDARTLSLDGCFPGLAERAAARRSVVRAIASSSKDARRRGLFRLKRGIGSIGAAARRQLPIELNRPVRDLVRDGTGFCVHAGADVRARAVVVATEAPAAARLLGNVSPELGAALDHLDYAPLSVVHWQSADARFGAGFGYLACPGENLFALGTIFHDPEEPGSNGGGRATAPSGYSTFVRGIQADDDSLKAGVANDVRRLTGGSVARVLRIDRWEHAVFQPSVEALPIRATLDSLAREASVVLAGSYLGAGAMKDALTSGFAAGERAAASLAP